VRPGGVVEKGKREGRERSGRALIGTGESLKTARINAGLLRGVSHRRFPVEEVMRGRRA
jgi:hypothetical protein